ncbi:MAG: patatin-like phospholipase family protein [Myxococcales bacterium]|nr:patatin-like phospholipase family protein [Myxococcales bacterium]
MKKDAPPLNPPRIGLFVSSAVYESTEKALQEMSHPPPEGVENGFHICLKNGAKLICRLLTDTPESLAQASAHPLDAVLIDNRHAPPGSGFAGSLAGRLLPEILSSDETRRSPLRGTILIVLPEDANTPYHAYAIGSFQIGGILINPPSLDDLLTRAYRVSRPKNPGKVALCLAGGGIEGMFYEIGVLRALDALLEGSSIIDFDMFSGISAGASIGAFLANGVKPYEIANALHGRPSRVAPVNRTMLFDPNLGEISRRVLVSVGDLMRGRWLTSPIDTALKVTPTALFSGDRLKAYLRKEMTKPGMTDSFHQLRRPLFIGCTDQDSGTHVTFGENDRMDVPVSQAVRASMAMTPYYNPEKIGDRFYVDGIFTRTINIDVAIAHGAKLIICVDPLRPVEKQEAGFVHERGGIFNTVQSVKSMIRTRFAEMVDRTGEAHPDVSIILFSPSGRDMEQMSGTMMRFFYRTETENMAYDSTKERILSEYKWFAAVFSRHGYRLKPPGTLHGNAQQ